VQLGRVEISVRIGHKWAECASEQVTFGDGAIGFEGYLTSNGHSARCARVADRRPLYVQPNWGHTPRPPIVTTSSQYQYGMQNSAEWMHSVPLNHAEHLYWQAVRSPGDSLCLRGALISSP
jgi:hypothetical protein